MMPFIHSILCCGFLLVLEAKVEWKEAGKLAAEEAHQAAAADEKWVYAITNTKVAKYDRKTGKRAAVSTGEAKHLNSGFLWENQLLCAHSNYPQLPEQSEIKTLNPETMKLTTFHNFADFGGSLTWVVRHDNHWWCNFAKYGAKNAETFLVKFNDQWQEQARWTYPQAVIQQIGTASLSGGIWHQDSLLVTDHDHPRLYRLRVPEKGTVLEFVELQTIPFTGQGIAADPLTGGLVGIHRPQRQVLFANPPSDAKETK